MQRNYYARSQLLLEMKKKEKKTYFQNKQKPAI